MGGVAGSASLTQGPSVEATHEGEHGVVGAAGGLQAEQKVGSQRAVLLAGGPTAPCNPDTNPQPEHSGTAGSKLLPLTACSSVSSATIGQRKSSCLPI